MTTDFMSMIDSATVSGRLNNKYMPDIFRTRHITSIKRLLDDAISNDEFTLVYQPQSDISTHKIVGAEALLRWDSAKFGQISPVDFISVAEATGFIQDLGGFVIEKACEQAAYWNEILSDKFRIAINVSSLQLENDNFVNIIESCLQKYNLDATSLEIELTESLLIEDKDRVIRVLHNLNEIGVRTVMDDFGTGYSSLNYLASMPLKMLKIDQSFVSMLGKSEANSTITQMIIQMAKKLDMDVLAEGVETAYQNKILKAYDCDYIQGRLISMPMSSYDMTQFMHYNGFLKN